jgi:hypothetical protein
MRKITKPRLAAIAAFSLIIGLLAGCSAGAPNAEAGTKTDAPKAEQITDLDDWQLAYAKCMRAEGLDMPDPDGRGFVTSTDQGNSEKYLAASESCLTKLGEPPAAPGQEKQSEEEMLAEQLKMAKCFRDNGVEVPDPKEGEVLGVQGEVSDEVMEKCLGGAGGSAPSITKEMN